ncbi:MAG: DUF3168 domain-containing protein [Gemmatimonadales bacterium]|nr:DUF3168 domain-containing protein [Gemmatimonadales bacterium]
MAQLVTVPVWDALVALVIAAAPPAPSGLLNADRIYRDGEVPETAALGYILIGSAIQPRGGFYNGQRGRTDQLYRLHCWSTTPTNAERIAAWLTALLDGQLLTLAGHTMWTSRITSFGHQADTDRTAYQVVLNWDVSTLEV